MKSLRKYYFLILSLVLVILAVLFLSPTPLNWTETFHVEGKNPYDYYILNQELNEVLGSEVIRSGDTPYQFLEENPEPKKYNFLFFGNRTHILDEYSFKEILKKVEEGSVFFGAMKDLPYFIADTLNVQTNHTYSDSTSLVITTKIAKNRTFLLKKTALQTYFSEIKNPNVRILGYMQEKSQKKVNFIEISEGKGKIYLFLEPLVFTNFYLKDNTDIQQLASIVLGYLPKENTSVWFHSGFNENITKEDGYTEKNALSFIMDNPPLRIAWQIFIFGGVIFLIFSVKRRQRIIPVWELPKNTTLDFVQTIANLYYQQQGNAEILQKQIIYFLDKVRNVFYIDTQYLNEDFIDSLQAKSGKERILIQNIVNEIKKYRENPKASSADLIRFNQLIERFWGKE